MYTVLSSFDNYELCLNRFRRAISPSVKLVVVGWDTLFYVKKLIPTANRLFGPEMDLSCVFLKLAG